MCVYEYHNKRISLKYNTKKQTLDSLAQTDHFNCSDGVMFHDCFLHKHLLFVSVALGRALNP